MSDRWADDGVQPWPEVLAGLPPLPVLVAYPYMKANMARRFAAMGDTVEVLIDCGAFTAWKAGKSVSLDEYCSFLDGLPFKPWRYFALDVIGDPEATARNLEIMRARGYDPMPIVTRGETLDEMDRLFGLTDCLGLGGVSGADKASYAWVRHMMNHADSRKTHILGFTDTDWIKYLRPYSCDSSSWASGSRYGTLTLYMGQGSMKALPAEKYALRRPDPAVAARMLRYGIDPAELRDRKARSGMDAPLQRLCTASWAELSIDVRLRFGTRLFLVAVGEDQVDLMLQGRERVLAARGGSLRRPA